MSDRPDQIVTLTYEQWAVFMGKTATMLRASDTPDDIGFWTDALDALIAATPVEEADA